MKDGLVALWGPGVLRSDGTADRRAVAAVVFPDPAERRKLEALVFPHIGRRVRAEIAAADADPAARFVAVDAAVMLEAGWNGLCDRVIYVDAPREVRLARLAARSGWTPAEVAAREAAQMPAAQKISLADAVLLNDGGPERVAGRLDDILRAWGLLPPAPELPTAPP